MTTRKICCSRLTRWNKVRDQLLRTKVVVMATLFTVNSSIYKLFATSSSFSKKLIRFSVMAQLNTKVPVWLLVGGSFNPVTNAHLRMFELAKYHVDNKLTGFEVTKGIISPVSDTYGEKKNLLPAKVRSDMVQLALNDVSEELSWVTVDDWEASQQGWTRLLEVMRHFHEKMMEEHENCDGPKPQLKLLCGADLLESFAKPGLWLDEDLQEIVGKFGVIVVTRQGSDPYHFVDQHSILKTNQSNVTIIPEKLGGTDISSTNIRAAIASGSPITFATQRSVIKFIKSNHLYS